MTQQSPPIERLYVARMEEDHRTEAGYEMLQASLGTYCVREVVDIEQADAMVVLGGDGGFFHAAHKYGLPDVPVTGVSTGTLGWYMSTVSTAEDIDYLVRNLAEGDYSLHNLPLLELRSLGNELIRLSVNDIVIKAAGMQAFKAGLTITGEPFAHFVGDGFIFSTPQGSSGQGVANGGPFIREGMPAWAVTPCAKHISKEYYSLIEPMVLSAQDDVEVRVKEVTKRPFRVGVDGDELLDWPADEHGFRVRMSPDKSIKRIRLNNNTYMHDISRIFRGQRAVE